jgi:hypothetical protein
MQTYTGYDNEGRGNIEIFYIGSQIIPPSTVQLTHLLVLLFTFTKCFGPTWISSGVLSQNLLHYVVYLSSSVTRECDLS